MDAPSIVVDGEIYKDVSYHLHSYALHSQASSLLVPLQGPDSSSQWPACLPFTFYAWWLLQMEDWAKQGPRPDIPAHRQHELINKFSTEDFEMAVANADECHQMTRLNQREAYEERVAELGLEPQNLPQAPQLELGAKLHDIAARANKLRVPGTAAGRERATKLVKELHNELMVREVPWNFERDSLEPFSFTFPCSAPSC